MLEKLDGVDEGESVIRLALVLALQASGRRRSGGARLAGARHRLLERGRQIKDPELCRSFLEEIPENVRTLDLARSLDEAAGRAATLLGPAETTGGSGGSGQSA